MHSKEIGWYHVDGFLIIFPNYIANFQQWSQYSLIVLLHSKPKQTNVIQHYWTRKSKTTPENIFGSQGCITHPQYEYRCIFPKTTGSFSCTVKYEIYFFFAFLSCTSSLLMRGGFGKNTCPVFCEIPHRHRQDYLNPSRWKSFLAKR